MNEKQKNFKRISESRKNKIIELISKLHNLNNTAFYDYTEEDVNELFDSISYSLNEERKKFNKMENVKDLVEQKLIELGFKVSLSDMYTFLIEKGGKKKLIKVINTKGKYAKWKASDSDESVNDDLYYICVRNDDGYKFHIIPSYDFAMNIKTYHKSFIEKNGGNGASNSMREFLDKPSIHIPEKEENEYLDNWDALE